MYFEHSLFAALSVCLESTARKPAPRRRPTRVKAVAAFAAPPRRCAAPGCDNTVPQERMQARALYCCRACRAMAKRQRVAGRKRLRGEERLRLEEEFRLALPFALSECPYAAGQIKMPDGGRLPDPDLGF